MKSRRVFYRQAQWVTHSKVLSPSGEIPLTVVRKVGRHAHYKFTETQTAARVITALHNCNVKEQRSRHADDPHLRPELCTTVCHRSAPHRPLQSQGSTPWGHRLLPLLAHCNNPGAGLRATGTARFLPGGAKAWSNKEKRWRKEGDEEIALISS